MSLGIWLTIAAALAWSAFDACRKTLVASTRPAPLAAALAWAQAPVFALWAWAEADSHIQASYLVPGLKVALLNTVACLGFFTALRRADLSRTVPLLSLSPVFASLLSAWVLDERLHSEQWVGVALVVGGALLLAKPRRDSHGARDWRGPAWMTLTALFWAGTTVYDKVSLQHASMAAHAGVQTLALALALSLWLAARGQLNAMATVQQRPVVFIVGVLVSTLALGLQLEAISLIPVGIMESLKRATGMVAALLVGRLVFNEALGALKWSAVSAMSVGVWFVVQP